MIIIELYIVVAEEINFHKSGPVGDWFRAGQSRHLTAALAGSASVRVRGSAWAKRLRENSLSTCLRMVLFVASDESSNQQYWRV